MSLYNQLFGINPNADILLKSIGLNKDSFSRFRDIHLLATNKSYKLIVLTRIGGVNRKSRTELIQNLQAHPNYLADYDNTFDNTFAYFEFSVPNDVKDKIDQYAEDKIVPVDVKFKTLMDAMKNGVKNTETENAMNVGEKIMSLIQENDSGIIKI